MAVKTGGQDTSATAPQILLKADTITLALTGEKDGKIRAKASAWEEPVVLLPGQRIEVRNQNGQVVLLRLEGKK